ncbi:hypothetical protein LJY25_20465 [Hymenobacter sp. BT175]|uniref:hypothetical protein n=1 Tax=Hymenobacter translucens TaxID=2886507 RepID=UPI001D0E74D5|nr:hypothetical protein [Hymenobacter translucens]MCC2548835.1 hypothetical protein [Hymenobacter translucens]
MKHAYTLALLSSLLGLAAGRTQAQSLVSGFMMGKGHGTAVISGTVEGYRKVFLVPANAEEVPIFKEIRVSSLNLYSTYGVTDQIDLVVSVPYIRSEGQFNAVGFTKSRADLQDITGLLKFKSYSTQVGNSILDLLGVVSVSTPLSNYKNEQGLDYIIAIGNRATKLSTVGVAHLKTTSGVFLTGQAGYSYRTGPVPDAFIAETKVGYAGRKIYADAYASFQESSSSGTDILRPGFNDFFPATRVDYVRLGASVFRPLAKGIGLSLGATSYVSGRNVGKSTGYSAGITYNF